MTSSQTATASNDLKQAPSIQKNRTWSNLPLHLRPSLAFPSNAVLTATVELMKNDPNINLRGTSLDTTMSAEERDEVIRKLANDNTESNNADERTYIPGVVNSKPLPERFTKLSNFNTKKQHPLYRTSNGAYGEQSPNKEDLPRVFFATRQDFSKTFNNNMPHFSGLNTSVQEKNIPGKFGL